MTTGRINQVSHQFLEQNNNSLALVRRSAPGLEKNLGAPTARRRKKPFSHGSQLLTTSTLCILPCPRCGVPNSKGNLHRTRAKNAEIRSKISKKVRYHLQSFELGPHKANWRKKPPRAGRFFIIDAHNNRKKTAVAVSMKKRTTGDQPQKKNHRRERRIGDPRTQTPIRCQNRTPKLARLLRKKLKTRPNA